MKEVDVIQSNEVIEKRLEGKKNKVTARDLAESGYCY